ncbi:hypothetical protein AVEN_246171-1 [Araneus ventricosus]|uniref:Uncharacterized protein n=2 Tax=Araneus ventricosus TaxID=182803 RepID=A0A4Y2WD33_ARAVE|nr:hypothetical protein AVEN_246171-1 [Araneus ventricosus]
MCQERLSALAVLKIENTVDIDFTKAIFNIQPTLEVSSALGSSSILAVSACRVFPSLLQVERDQTTFIRRAEGGRGEITSFDKERGEWTKKSDHIRLTNNSALSCHVCGHSAVLSRPLGQDPPGHLHPGRGRLGGVDPALDHPQAPPEPQAAPGALDQLALGRVPALLGDGFCERFCQAQ